MSVALALNLQRRVSRERGRLPDDGGYQFGKYRKPMA